MAPRMHILNGRGVRDAAASPPVTRSFSFRTVAPSLTRSVVTRFATVDRIARAYQATLTKADLTEFVAYGFALRNSEPARLAAGKTVVDALDESWKGMSAINEIRNVNACIRDQSRGRSEWRSTAVWVGRVPRARSVFEGAAPQDIPRLMSVWNSFHERNIPLSLQLAVSSLRLLQIHPFLDGNGRTARWMALRLARRHPSVSVGFDSLIASVWRKGAAFRHACSASVIEQEDWEPWLNAWSDESVFK